MQAKVTFLEHRRCLPYGTERPVERRRPRPPPRSFSPDYTVQDAVDALVSRGCLDCAPDTVRFYRLKAGHLVRLFGATSPLADLTMHLVREYISIRQQEGAKDGTILKELITLRRALKLAQEDRYFEGNPAEVVPRFRVRYIPRERWLTPQQVQLLLGELESPRRLWVLIAAFAGARFSEVERLSWEHVDLESGWVLLPGTKTAKSRRRIPLAPVLIEALRREPEKVGPVVQPWMSVRRDLACACARAKIPTVTPNDLRRTFASWLKQAGQDSMVVAKLLGHSTSRMDELVYGHLSTKEYLGAIADLPIFTTEPQ